MVREPPSQEYLKEMLHYDHENGVFTWKVRPPHHFKDPSITKGFNTKYAGTVVKIHTRKYPKLVINYRHCPLHRLAWLYHYGYWPGMLDHINHDHKDFRIANLREVTYDENARNQPMSKSNTSGRVGVTWHSPTKRWVATIKVRKQPIHLGYHVDFEDACAARAKAEKEHNFHPNHGMPFNPASQLTRE